MKKLKISKETYSENCKILNVFLVKPSDKVPDDEGQLAYWVSRTLPLKDFHRVKMLGLGSALERLQYALSRLRMVRTIQFLSY